MRSFSEPELESFLQMLSSEAWDQVQGASDQEMAALEKLAGRTLPVFYHWFLQRMGRSMGGFSHNAYDCSAAKILAAYQDEKLFVPHPRYFVIGYQKGWENSPVTYHWGYDLDHPMQDDARLVRIEELETPSVEPEADTFREEIASHAFWKFRIKPANDQCYGSIIHKSQSAVMTVLDAALKSYGLNTPGSSLMGPSCLLYGGPNIALRIRLTPGDSLDVCRFTLGCNDLPTRKKLVNALSRDGSIQVSVREFPPPSKR